MKLKRRVFWKINCDFSLAAYRSRGAHSSLESSWVGFLFGINADDLVAELQKF